MSPDTHDPTSPRSYLGQLSRQVAIARLRVPSDDRAAQALVVLEQAVRSGDSARALEAYAGLPAELRERLGPPP